MQELIPKLSCYLNNLSTQLQKQDFIRRVMWQLPWITMEAKHPYIGKGLKLDKPISIFHNFISSFIGYSSFQFIIKFSYYIERESIVYSTKMLFTLDHFQLREIVVNSWLNLSESIILIKTWEYILHGQ